MTTIQRSSVSRTPRGYTETSETTALKRDLSRKRPGLSALTLASDPAQLLALGLTWTWTLRHATAAGICSTPLLLLLAGRAMRGMEAMIHEASHHNLFGNKWDDRAVDALAALPMFQTVEQYRTAHLPEHHGGFGGPKDPCAARFVSGTLGKLIRRSHLSLLISAARQVPSALNEWYGTSGLDRHILEKAAAWHMALWLTLLLLLPPAYVLGTAVLWTAGVSLMLPVLRVIGESDEHDYTAETEQRATFSMTSRWHRFLVHPHGDGFHAEHHRFPTVPHHALPKLRRGLLKTDPTWKTAPTHTGLLWPERNTK